MSSENLVNGELRYYLSITYRHQTFAFQEGPLADSATSGLLKPCRDCYRGSMPSPVGHVLAGLTAGWLAQSLPGPTRVRRLAMTSVPMVCACLAIAPDVDLVLTTHRAYTHSIGATTLLGLGAAVIARWRHWPGAVERRRGCGSLRGSRAA